MTKHECAVVMAYTGVTMLSGNDFGIFHKYCEDLLCRPIYTHEFAIELVANNIKKLAEPEFIKICEEATDE